MPPLLPTPTPRKPAPPPCLLNARHAPAIVWPHRVLALPCTMQAQELVHSSQGLHQRLLGFTHVRLSRVDQVLVGRNDMVLSAG